MSLRLQANVRFLRFLLYRVAAKVAGAANTDYRAIGINLMGARVLFSLLNGRETVGVLAQGTDIDQPTLSHVLKRLVRGDRGKKERQAHDNRTVLIALTQTGPRFGAALYVARSAVRAPHHCQAITGSDAGAERRAQAGAR